MSRKQLIITMLIAAVVFTLLAVRLSLLGVGLELDAALVHGLRDSHDPLKPLGPGWGLPFMQGVTALGSWPFVTLLTTFVGVFLLLGRSYKKFFLLLGAVIGKSLWIPLLKDLFDRARPDIIHLVEASSESFPSGHATIAATLIIALTIIGADLIARKSQRYFVYAAAGLMIFLIGFSRVYLGVHYPSDVIAGWAFGVFWVCALMLCADIWWPKAKVNG